MKNLIRISTTDMTRKEWLEERRKAIGGSDTAGILGQNPYATPYTIWADKTRRLPEKEDNEAMRQGRDLEQYVADRFTELSGKKTRKINAIIKNPKYPFASANIDRSIVNEPSGLECKTTSLLNLKKFKDGEFPFNYYSQSVHYLAVTECTRWYVAVLILNKDFKIYQLTRFPNDEKPEWCESSVYVSDEEINALMVEEAKFWHLVETDTPPQLSGTKPDTDALSAIYRGENTDDVVNLSAQYPILQKYLGLKTQIKELEQQMTKCEQTLKLSLQDAQIGETGNFLVKWTIQSRTSFDAKQFAKENLTLDLSKYYRKTNYRKFEIKEIV